MDISYRIAQIGTFDLENYGDLLFPIVLKNELEQRIKGVELTLFSPLGADMPYYENSVYPLSQLEQEHLQKNFDAFIIGGGDIIRLDENVASNEKYPARGLTSDLWVLPVLIAQRYQIPVGFNAPGVPFPLPKSRYPFLKEVLESIDYLSVRDDISAGFLREVDENLSVSSVPDTIFLLKNVYSQQSLDEVYHNLQVELQLPSQFILFQINHLEEIVPLKEYVDILRRLEDSLGIPVVFFPIGHVHWDSELLNRINQESDFHFRQIKDKLGPKEMAAVISHSKGFLGTSYHGCMTSHLFGNPAVVINDARLVKVEGYFQILPSCAKGMCHSIREVRPELFEITAAEDEIQEAVKRAGAHMDQLASRITKKGLIKERLSEPTLRQLLRYAFTASGLKEKLRWGTIYWDCGEGFSQDKSEMIPVVGEPGRVSWKGKIPPDVKRIRWDPLEGACAVASSQIMNNGKVLEAQPLNGIQIQGCFYFCNTDPQILAAGQEDLSGELEIKGEVYCLEHKTGFLPILEVDNLRNAVSAKEEKLEQERNQIQDLNQEIERVRAQAQWVQAELDQAKADLEECRKKEEMLHGALDALNQEYSQVTSSKSWRYTEWIRMLYSRLK